MDASPLLALLTWIATIVILGIASYAGIVLLARLVARFMPATPPPRDPALDALRTRFAAGEIDEAEYQRLRSVLQRG